eukprot:GILI01004244.1.p2 GENE.GILI01004244.1~~GILI01004244.1.p2  ORF type:complete len:207 (-),score=79.38 GILI01004244.1:183-803(-)
MSWMGTHADPQPVMAAGAVFSNNNLALPVWCEDKPGSTPSSSSAAPIEALIFGGISFAYDVDALVLDLSELCLSVHQPSPPRALSDLRSGPVQHLLHLLAVKFPKTKFQFLWRNPKDVTAPARLFNSIEEIESAGVLPQTPPLAAREKRTHKPTVVTPSALTGGTGMEEELEFSDINVVDNSPPALPLAEAVKKGHVRNHRRHHRQ